MKVAKKILCVLMAIFAIATFSVVGTADFGDYAGDYDYGGYDSGGYDSYDDDDDYYFGGYSSDDSNYSSGSRGGGGSIGGTLGLLFIIGLYLLLKKRGYTPSQTGKKIAPVAPGATKTDISTLKPIQGYYALDPEFSEAGFKEKLSNMYVKFQDSWQKKNLEDLRPYLSDAMYAQCDRQLDAYRIKKQTNMIEHIAVLDVALSGWKQEQGCDVMVAILKTRITDYVIDDATGEVVNGSNSTEKFMTYEWTLQRTSGRTTGTSTGTKAQNCPNCGAPVDINSSAVCPYCGCVLTTDSFDWIVTNIKGISQISR